MNKTVDKILPFFIGLSVALIPFYFLRFSVTNIFEVVLMFTSILVVINLILKRQKVEFGPLWPYIFLLLAFVSIFFAPDLAKALGIFKGWFLMPALLYFLIINSVKQVRINQLVLCTYWPMIIVSLWAILQKAGLVTTLFYQVGDASFGQYLNNSIRAFGPFESPNFLAMYLVPTFFLSIINFNNIKTTFIKVLFACSLALPLLAIYFSGSRGGELALAGSVFVGLILIYIKKKQSLILILGIFMFVALIFGGSRAISGQAGDRAGSNETRKQIYSYSIKLVEKNWLFGVGLGGFEKAIDTETRLDVDFQKNVLISALHPHNVFLAMCLNLGLLGLITFLFIVYSTFARFAKIFSTKDWLVSIVIGLALISILFHGMFDTTYYKNDLAAIFWLILSFVYLLEYTHKHDAKIIKN
jgi:O-antigen ligase